MHHLFFSKQVFIMSLKFNYDISLISIWYMYLKTVCNFYESSQYLYIVGTNPIDLNTCLIFRGCALK